MCASLALCEHNMYSTCIWFRWVSYWMALWICLLFQRKKKSAAAEVEAHNFSAGPFCILCYAPLISSLHWNKHVLFDYISLYTDSSLNTYCIWTRLYKQFETVRLAQNWLGSNRHTYTSKTRKSTESNAFSHWQLHIATTPFVHDSSGHRQFAFRCDESCDQDSNENFSGKLPIFLWCVLRTQFMCAKASSTLVNKRHTAVECI